MRLISWNCYRGDILERTTRLATLQPDVIALQECRRPKTQVGGWFWRGELDQQGVAVVAGTTPVEPVPLPSGFPSTVLPVLILAPVPFVLVNVWTLPKNTYEEFALTAASMCASTVGDALPTVLIGDFNSSPAVAYQRKTSREMLRRLREEFGLVSAYHARHEVEFGDECDHTYFHRWKQDARFHIDYCFIPQTWVERIRTVDVGGYEEWKLESDHRPLIVDVDI